MPTLVVDREECTRDGLCSRECPLTLIGRDETGLPKPAPHFEAACVRCGHCVSVCPRGCLSLGGEGGFGPDKLPLAPVRPDVAPRELQDWIKSRRSVRDFAARPVDRESIESCLETARYAPTAMNGQPMEWIVLTDAGAIREIAGMCADYLRQRGMMSIFVEPFDAGRETILRGAPCLVAVHALTSAPIPPATDCVIALAHFELAAHALGLGTCWAGILRHVATSSQPVREVLGLPEGHEMYGALMVGWPKHKLLRLPPRKPVRVVWR